MSMEVKVKDGDMLIDATVEVENGVMLITPKAPLSKRGKKEKWAPKDGDFVTTEMGIQVFINKEYLGHNRGYAYFGLNRISGEKFNNGVWAYSRYATEEEKKLFLDKLAEQGLEWDEEKKKLMKVKWTPKDGERFYYPSFSGARFYARVAIENKIMPVTEWEEYEKGWIFRTAEECRALCDKLNAAVAAVTP